MSKQMQNATNLYLRGIRDGYIDEVLENYMGDSYTQHSTGVKDGKAGFKEFFQDFHKRNTERDIQIVRTFEDGPYVFQHVYQNLNGGQAQWITTDIFRADDQGRIVEHWDVIDAYPQNKPAVDPIFGDFQIEDEDQTEQNKAKIRLFLTYVMQNHDYTRFNDFVKDNYVEHDAASYLDYLKDNDVTYDFVFKVLGQGNYVVSYSQVTIAGTAYAMFDIFRLEDGKIAEHWVNKEVMPKRSELTNSGKF